MPEENVLKFGADFKDVDKAFFKVGQAVDNLSKKGVSFKLDSKTEKFLSEQQVRVIERLTKQVDGATQAFSKMAQQVSATGEGVEKLDKIATITERLSKRLSTARGMKFGTIAGGTAGGGGAAGAAGSELTGEVIGNALGVIGLGRLSGVSRRIGAAGGGGAAVGGAGFAVGGAGLAAGAIGAVIAAGVATAVWGYRRTSKYADAGLKYQAIGYDRERMQEGAVRPGRANMYNREESLAMGLQWAGQTGGLGGLGMGMAVSRGFGLDFGQVAGVGGLARKQGGDQRKNFVDMLAQGVASGVEIAKLPEYLQVQSQMLAGVLQKGPADLNFLSSLMSTVTKKGGQFAQFNPAATAATIQSLSAGITAQGAGGGLFGLLAPAIMKQPRFKNVHGAYDIENVTSYGFAAPDLSKYKNLPPEYRKYLEGLSMDKPGASRALMGVMYESIFGTPEKPNKGLISRGVLQGYMPSATGSELDTAAELLGTAHKYSGEKRGGEATKEFMKMLVEKNKTVQESMDGTLKKINVGVDTIKDILGFSVAGFLYKATGLKAYNDLKQWQETGKSEEIDYGYGFGSEGETPVRDINGKWIPSKKPGRRMASHNNPLAFTTGFGSILEKAGIDYDIGQSFDGGRYNTAKFKTPQKGWAASMYLMENDPAFFKWYKSGAEYTQGGNVGPLKGLTQEQFRGNLTQEQKNKKIAELNRLEGGSGVFVSDPDSGGIANAIEAAFKSAMMSSWTPGINKMVGKQEETKQEIIKQGGTTTNAVNVFEQNNIK